MAANPAGGFPVTAEAVRKSGRVLFAFSSFYLPLYDLPLSCVFGRYDVFGYLSAAIYEIDEQVEILHAPVRYHNQLNDLCTYLSGKITIDANIERLITDAEEYYALERRLLAQERLALPEVMANAERRSFDFRLMHRALVQLNGWHYDETLLHWFRAFEMRMEVEDDIQSFDEDCRRNTFNTACLAAGLAGRSAFSFLEDYRSGLEDAIETGLTRLSVPQQNRCRVVLARYREIVPRPSTPTAKDL